MKKLMILCIATGALISNVPLLGMLTNKCRLLTRNMNSLKKYHPQDSSFNYPELLKQLEADKIDIDQKIKFIKEMMYKETHLSDSQKTIDFRSSDKLNNSNK